jgi:hypothetical protein
MQFTINNKGDIFYPILLLNQAFPAGKTHGNRFNPDIKFPFR